ncbi:hypothetical protein M6B38_300460 [Iris pallida]|uniref:Uncharacterized protein n=1 Tax=Iris pallida TaxID=29817 RepID=A0AAX6HR01_IRIPA|nr:hypothetical protein M6B38_353090 [Iris pallida]KAJ6835622.1 hypothetical protein M6B38_331675 [Iris pallida]KAJ6843153.1 hypothetical protein M6B38_300460 [Iris pallida]
MVHLVAFFCPMPTVDVCQCSIIKIHMELIYHLAVANYTYLLRILMMLHRQ